MTGREKQKIKARIAQLQQKQVNLKAQTGQHFQAIHEIGMAFEVLAGKIEELRDLSEPKKSEK